MKHTLAVRNQVNADAALRETRHPQPGPFRSAAFPDAPCAVDLAADAVAAVAERATNRFRGRFVWGGRQAPDALAWVGVDELPAGRGRG